MVENNGSGENLRENGMGIKALLGSATYAGKGEGTLPTCGGRTWVKRGEMKVCVSINPKWKGSRKTR